MTFDVLVPNQMSICDNVPTISVYSQVVDFIFPVLPNSVRYKCDGSTVETEYGTDCEDMAELIDMLNANNQFTQYGTYFDNEDGRVRLEMLENIANNLCPDGELTLQIFRD
jgi:hypothetical protein